MSLRFKEVPLISQTEISGELKTGTFSLVSLSESL